MGKGKESYIFIVYITSNITVGGICQQFDDERTIFRKKNVTYQKKEQDNLES